MQKTESAIREIRPLANFAIFGDIVGGIMGRFPPHVPRDASGIQAVPTFTGDNNEYATNHFCGKMRRFRIYSFLLAVVSQGYSSSTAQLSGAAV